MSLVLLLSLSRTLTGTLSRMALSSFSARKRHARPRESAYAVRTTTSSLDLLSAFVPIEK